MSEAEVLAVARRLDLRRKAGFVLTAVAVVFAAVIAFQFLPSASEHLGWGEVLTFGGAAILFLAAGIGLVVTARLPAEAKTERITMLRAERQQAVRRVAFLFMPVSLFLLLMGTLRAADATLDGKPIRSVDLFTTTAFIIFLVLFALLIAGLGVPRSFRSVIDDELSRELRRKALVFGYAIVLPGLAALFVVALVSRTLAIELMPVLAALGVAGPAVRLSLLERAAAADPDEG